MKTYCFALGLHDDLALIAEYKWYHQLENAWPNVLECIRGEGVVSEDTYLAGNRLFMVLQTTDSFSLDAKRAADTMNAEMQKREALMSKFQKPLEVTFPGEKWVLMEKMFEMR